MISLNVYYVFILRWYIRIPVCNTLLYDDNMKPIGKRTYERQGRVYSCWTRIETELVIEALEQVALQNHPARAVLNRLAGRLRSRQIVGVPPYPPETPADGS